MYKYWIGRKGEEGPNSSQKNPLTGQLKLYVKTKTIKHVKLSVNTRRYILTVQAVKHWQRFSREVVEFFPEDTQNPAGHGPVPPTLVDSA